MEPKDFEVKNHCKVCNQELTLVFLSSKLLKIMQNPKNLDCTESRYSVFYKIPKHRKSLFKVCEGSEQLLNRRMAIKHNAKNQSNPYSFRFIKRIKRFD